MPLRTRSLVCSILATAALLSLPLVLSGLGSDRDATGPVASGESHLRARSTELQQRR